MVLANLLYSNNISRKAFLTPGYDKMFREALKKLDWKTIVWREAIGDRFKDWQDRVEDEGAQESDIKIA